MLLELAERFQDTAVAPLLVDELEPYARGSVGGLGTSTVWFIGNSNRQLGRALVLAGRLEDAVTAYRTAMDCDERIGARPDVALGRLDIARTLARADWPTADRPATLRAALAGARSAADECRGLDMPGHASRADALVAELTRSLAADDPLSPREREVVDLVVAGPHEPRDRGPALPQRADRREPRPGRAHEAGLPQPRRAGAPRDRRRSRSHAGTEGINVSRQAFPPCHPGQAPPV